MGGQLFKNFSFLSATLAFFMLVGIFSVLFNLAQESLTLLVLTFSILRSGNRVKMMKAESLVGIFLL